MISLRKDQYVSSHNIYYGNLKPAKIADAYKRFSQSQPREESQLE